MKTKLSLQQIRIQHELLHLNSEIEKCVERMNKLDEHRQKLLSKCSHQNPDGSTAIESGWAMNSCTICNWNDYGPG